MIRRIMLTGLIACAIITFVGCENGNKLEPSKSEELVYNEIQEESITEQISKEENMELTTIPEVYNYNESGKIIIAMYHKFTSR